MFECAKNLEFEKAAAIRDKLSTVKNKFLVLTATTLMKKSKKFRHKRAQDRKIHTFIFQ